MNQPSAQVPRVSWWVRRASRPTEVAGTNAWTGAATSMKVRSRLLTRLSKPIGASMPPSLIDPTHGTSRHISHAESR